MRNNMVSFNNFFDDWFYERKDLMKSDVKELDNGYELKIDMPGFNKDNIKISIEDGNLVIQGELKKENEENEKFIRRERYYGKVSRSYYLGEGLTEEDVKASFNDGVLTLNVNKPKERIETKKYISIE